jgi:hypothetical protein
MLCIVIIIAIHFKTTSIYRENKQTYLLNLIIIFMAKNAIQITQELGNYGKYIGDHSMGGGMRALKLAIIVAAVTGLAVGYVVGSQTK